MTLYYRPTAIASDGRIFSMPIPIKVSDGTPVKENDFAIIPGTPGQRLVAQHPVGTRFTVSGWIVGYPLNQAGYRNYTQSPTSADALAIMREMRGYHNASHVMSPGVFDGQFSFMRWSDELWTQCVLESAVFNEGAMIAGIITYSLDIIACNPYSYLGPPGTIPTTGAGTNGQNLGGPFIGGDFGPIIPPWEEGGETLFVGGTGNTAIPGGLQPVSIAPYQVPFQFSGIAEVGRQKILYLPDSGASQHILGIGIMGSDGSVPGASGNTTLTVSASSLGSGISVSATEAQETKPPVTASPGVEIAAGAPVYVHIAAAAGGHVNLDGFLFVQPY